MNALNANAREREIAALRAEAAALRRTLEEARAALQALVTCPGAATRRCHATCHELAQEAIERLAPPAATPPPPATQARGLIPRCGPSHFSAPAPPPAEPRRSHGPAASDVPDAIGALAVLEAGAPRNPEKP